MDDEYENRIWRRNIFFTSLKIIELCICLSLYIYFVAVYQAFAMRPSAIDVHDFMLCGFSISTWIMFAVVLVRYLSVPKHIVTPLDVTVCLWFWLSYLIIAMVVMDSIPIDSRRASLAKAAKVIAVGSIFLSKLFMLDAFLMLDVLIIRSPLFDTFRDDSLSTSGRSGQQKTPVPIVSITTSNKIHVIEPLEIDFFWLRCPECLLEEGEGSFQFTQSMSYLEEDPDIRDFYHTIEKLKDSPENIMSKYANAIRKRRLSQTSDTAVSQISDHTRASIQNIKELVQKTNLITIPQTQKPVRSPLADEESNMYSISEEKVNFLTPTYGKKVYSPTVINEMDTKKMTVVEVIPPPKEDIPPVPPKGSSAEQVVDGILETAIINFQIQYS